MNIALLWFNYENRKLWNLRRASCVTICVPSSEFGVRLASHSELFALMQTPSLISTVNNPRLLKIIVFLNVVLP